MKTQVRLAARNAFRRPVRTALTAGMIVFAVALLLVALSWIGGVMGGSMKGATALGGHVRLVDPDFAAREVLMPLEENVPDVEQLAERVRKIEGVVAVEPRILTAVTVTAGEEIGEVFAMVVGASPAYYEKQLGLSDKLGSGRGFSGAPDELIAGATVVKQAGAKLGDTLVLLGVTQDGSLSPIKGTLVGVLEPTPGLDQQVLAPLERIQWLTDIPGGATELLVYGRDYEKAGSLAERLRAESFTAPYSVEAWGAREPWRGIGRTVKGMKSVIVFVIVFIAALGIWNTMMMSVLERTSELGVLRALGMSRLGAVGLFVGEAAAIGVIGGLLGVLLGAVPSALLERYGVHIGAKVAATSPVAISDTLHGDLNLEGVLTSFTLGLLMAIIGSLLPALRAASIQPVAAMRSGR